MMQPESLSSTEFSKKLLSFRLGAKDIAGIPVEDITETFQISLTQILPVPQMPECILGIYNWRGEMLWMVNLENLLSFEDSSIAVNPLSKPMAMVVQADGKSLGLIVGNVIDIESVNSQQMKAPTAELFNPEVLPFLRGYFVREEEQVLMNLETKAIFQSSRLKAGT